MPIYMKYEGIDGDSAAPGFLGAFELDSAQLGVTRSITSPTGTLSRDGAQPKNEILLTLRAGVAIQKLLKESLVGKGSKVTISFVRGKDEVYLKITLENALITNFNLGGGKTGDPLPSASLTLNFTKITFEQVNPAQGQNALKAGAATNKP